MSRLPFVPVCLTLLILLQITGCALTHPCSVPPTITGQPSNQVVEVGQIAILTVAATGSAPLSYQWLRNGVVIPGATQASYYTPPTTATDSGSTYSANVTNIFGNLASDKSTLTVNPAATTNVRYVAPSGDDSNPGTIAQPFRTIQHCATTVIQGWTCEVRAGTYRETVTPNSGIAITSYNFEPVIVDGSDPITGWTPYRGSIYKTIVTLGADDTNQIFAGGEMMTEARWPNSGDLFHVVWARAGDGTDRTHIVDSRLPSGDWTGAKIHLWSGGDPFGHETGTVAASGSGRIAIDVQVGTCNAICPQAGGFYYLFGTLGALDAEREWFYDSVSSTLYFMAPGGGDPNTLDVRGKRRLYAFDLRGRSGVTIRNLAIFSSTIVTDESSSNNVLDRINAQYVSHFTSLPTASDDPGGGKSSILFVHQHDSGIILSGSGNVLQNSTIANSAGAGVALEGNNNIVRNNLIQRVDYIGDYASGIDLDGDGNKIEYNTIHTVGRQAIFVDAVVDQDIGFNNLFDSMMLSRDGAEIYACCQQVASGIRIHHNWIHDTRSFIDGAGDSIAYSGIGIDNGSSGFDIDQNVLWNNQRFNILVNGASSLGPNNNNIHNNTIPDRSSNGRIGIINVPDCTSTRVVDNRVVVKVKGQKNDTACVVSNNRASSPGATEMAAPTEVGCNFDGCSSDSPSAILDDGFLTPCPVNAVLPR